MRSARSDESARAGARCSKRQPLLAGERQQLAALLVRACSPRENSVSWSSILPESKRARSSTSPSRLTRESALAWSSRARSGISAAMRGVGGGSPDQFGQEADGVGGRANVVADGGEEAGLADGGLFGLAAADVELALELFLGGDVNEHGDAAADGFGFRVEMGQA